MTFSTKLRDREPLVGTWLTLSDPAVAELSAQLGFDAVAVDVEHTPNSLETVADLLRAIDAAGTDAGSIVRVSENDPTEIKRVLDAGADGVMAPMVDTAAEARALVEATRFPPAGGRGVGIGRANDYGERLSEYVDGDDEVVTLAQIETEAGLANVEEIAAVDGLDGLFLGPADLSTALGAFGDFERDAFREAVDRVLEAGHAVDKPVATLALDESDVERWVDRGFDVVIAGVDLDYLKTGSRRAKSAFDDAVDSRTE